MEMTKQNMKEFRKDFEKVIQPLQEKYNVTIKLGYITYEEERFSTRLTVTNGTDADTVAQVQFDAEVWRYEHIGLTPGMYNKVFLGEDGQRYALRGFNPRARKWPIKMLRISDGEARVCNEHFIKELLNEYYTDVAVYE